MCLDGARDLLIRLGCTAVQPADKRRFFMLDIPALCFMPHASCSSLGGKSIGATDIDAGNKYGVSTEYGVWHRTTTRLGELLAVYRVCS